MCVHCSVVFAGTWLYKCWVHTVSGDSSGLISPISRMTYLDEKSVYSRECLSVWQGGEVKSSEGQWRGRDMYTGDDKRIKGRGEI